MNRRLLALVLTLGLSGFDVRSADACQALSAVLTHGMNGGFIIPQRGRAYDGPRIRFWQYGVYAGFNSGAQRQWPEESDIPWLVHAQSMFQASGANVAVDPDLYMLSQADWAGQSIVGCPFDLPAEQRRTVVEISFGVSSGSQEHHTVYLIVSTAWDVAQTSFYFDNVVNGNGSRPAEVAMQPIPIPRVSGAGVANPENTGYMNVTLALPEAKSYGDPSAPNLIAGYQLYYANDSVPVSNHAGDYRKVMDPERPRSAMASIPFGVSTVTVAVPKPSRMTYFVTELVYADASTVLLSKGVSGNSEPVPAIEGGGDGDEEAVDESQEVDDDSALDDVAADDTEGDAGNEDSVGDDARDSDERKQDDPGSGGSRDRDERASDGNEVGGSQPDRGAENDVSGQGGTSNLGALGSTLLPGNSGSATDRRRSTTNSEGGSPGPSRETARVPAPRTRTGIRQPARFDEPVAQSGDTTASGNMAETSEAVVGATSSSPANQEAEGVPAASAGAGADMATVSGRGEVQGEAAEAEPAVVAELRPDLPGVLETVSETAAGPATTGLSVSESSRGRAWMFLDVLFLSALALLSVLVLRGRGLVG